MLSSIRHDGIINNHTDNCAVVQSYIALACTVKHSNKLHGLWLSTGLYISENTICCIGHFTYSRSLYEIYNLILNKNTCFWSMIILHA